MVTAGSENETSIFGPRPPTILPTRATKHPTKHRQQTTDSGHMRGERVAFPARAVQKRWPQQISGHNKPATIMTMSVTGYARVSTADQDPRAQVTELQAAGCDPIYVEHASGATMERSQWNECNRGLGRGDTLVVVRIDRLGRSLADLVTLLTDLNARGVHLRSLTEGIDTSTPLGTMFYQLAGAFAEYERALISERTRAGLDAARAAGQRIGRPPALTNEQKATARHLHTQGHSIAATARILGVSRATIRRALSE